MTRLQTATFLLFALPLGCGGLGYKPIPGDPPATESDGDETDSGSETTAPSESTGDEPSGGTSDTDATGSTGTTGSPGIDVDELMPIRGICEPSGNDDPYADCVEDFIAAPEVSFGHDQLPDIVLGSPEGGLDGSGAVDVASMGCGGLVTLYFDPPHIVDGPGPDFIVFENPFTTGETTFTEPGQVLVSADGTTWHAFDCEPTGDGSWPPVGCAGIQPVHANTDNGWATDPQLAGGDAFDLADLGLTEVSYVRIVDRTLQHYGGPMWCGGAGGGFDLDAVAVVDHGGTR